MTPNTALFAEFIKGARTTANLTQDSLHDCGATYRQLQGRIENGDLIELEGGILAGYDTAYGWPRGYAGAVAQAGAYASGVEVPVKDLAERHTLAALYEPGRHNAPAAIGFDPATARAVYTDYGIVTNISFRDLRPVIDSRSGTTLLDTQLLDDRVMSSIVSDPLTSDRPRKFYRLSSKGAFASHGHIAEPIALDALTDITTLEEASQLARALLELSTAVNTTVERAAFTFLAIAAFGEDLFTTIRRLQEVGRFAIASGLPPQLADFGEFWTSFCTRHDVSAELATPDLEALSLLDELSRAREGAKSIDIGPPSTEGWRLGRSALPATVRTLTLALGEAEQDNFIFYDSEVAPQIPVCLNILAVGATLAIYRAGERRDLSRLSNPLAAYRSIGVAVGADDLSVVARHRPEHVNTLTNQFGRYAVFCESGRAGVVWIPGA